MRTRSIGFLGALALALAPVAMAQTPPTPQPQPEGTSTQQRTIENRTITGRVVEVDNDSLVVETASGQRMTFKVDHDLTTGAQPITVGSQVRVEYRGETELEVVNVSRAEATSPRPEATEPDRPEATAARPTEPAARPADPAARRDPAARPGVTAQTDPAAQPGAAQRDPGARQVRQTDRDPGALPATAGPLPILLLAGLSLLGGGLGLSRLRR